MKLTRKEAAQLLQAARALLLAPINVDTWSTRAGIVRTESLVHRLVHHRARDVDAWDGATLAERMRRRDRTVARLEARIREGRL